MNTVGGVGSTTVGGVVLLVLWKLQQLVEYMKWSQLKVFISLFLFEIINEGHPHFFDWSLSIWLCDTMEI